jgi:hypothetical protein
MSSSVAATERLVNRNKVCLAFGNGRLLCAKYNGPSTNGDPRQPNSMLQRPYVSQTDDVQYTEAHNLHKYTHP